MAESILYIPLGESESFEERESVALVAKTLGVGCRDVLGEVLNMKGESRKEALRLEQEMKGENEEDRLDQKRKVEGLKNTPPVYVSNKTRIRQSSSTQELHAKDVLLKKIAACGQDEFSFSLQGNVFCEYMGCATLIDPNEVITKFDQLLLDVFTADLVKERLSRKLHLSSNLQETFGSTENIFKSQLLLTEKEINSASIKKRISKLDEILNIDSKAGTIMYRGKSYNVKSKLQIEIFEALRNRLIEYLEGKSSSQWILENYISFKDNKKRRAALVLRRSELYEILVLGDKHGRFRLNLDI